MRALWILPVVALGGCSMGGAKYGAAPPGAMASAPAEIAAEPSTATAAQPAAETWKRSQIAPNASRLMVGEREELPLRSIQARVTIDGFRARVLIDYVYANDRDRQLEGNFQLRLPEEASPYFFAFGEAAYAAASPPMVIATSGAGAGSPAEIMAARAASWRNPREARIVPRDRAQLAYGATVRRRVDPGIVEWAGAGVFNARVFPLAPHQLHRIVIGYDLDLVRIGDGLAYRFDVPAKLPAIIDVSVAGPAAAVVSPAVAATTEATTEATADAVRTHYHFENPAGDAVTVTLPGARGATIVGADDRGNDRIGELFASQLQPVLPASAAGGAQDSAVFLVDTSLSSNPDRFNIHLHLLRAVLDGNRDTIKRFAVLFFGVDAWWYRPGFVDNTPDSVAALLAFADRLALEGATDLGAALAEASHPAWLPGGGHHDVLLLSDGAATWGEANRWALSRAFGDGHSLFAYQTGLAGTDVAALAQLTRDSGGAVFSVTGESEVARAAMAHRARPWRLVDAAVDGASDVLLAGRPRALFPGQTVTVVGRGALGPGAVLALTLERDGQRTVVRTPLGAPIRSALAPRAYGQIATAQLEELEAAAEPIAKAYATHFRVTGRTCSLLLLDTEQDHARFGIKPEEDAFVVGSTPAGALYAKTLAQTFQTLGDPKAAFLAMLDRLARMPEVRLAIPAAYRLAIEAMPAAAFDVPAPPLATHPRGKAELSPRLADLLAHHQLDYDAITADAGQRRSLGAGDALKALSSLVEDNPGDAVLARDVGFSAIDLGLPAQAYHLFRRVAEARPHEPQTYRAIAQTLARMGKTELALAYYEIPLMAQWDPRFGDLRAIVELDYLRFLRGVAGAARGPLADYARARLATLGRQIGLSRADLVVSITWNTDNTDVDLHVTEPGGEECYYSHRETRSGGRLTRDVTQGYGPEMYVLAAAPRGVYHIRAHYYASDRNRASARSKVYATVIRHWGTPEEQVIEKVVTLDYGKDMHDILTLSQGDEPATSIRAR